jgi:hypothetical protein
MYAELYRDFPELVPEGWEFDHADEYEAACIGTEGVCLFFDRDAHHPWFLTLALGRIRDWLEGKGWDERRFRLIALSKPIEWSWVRGWDAGKTPRFRCPHAAAIAAVRMVKENA